MLPTERIHMLSGRTLQCHAIRSVVSYVRYLACGLSSDLATAVRVINLNLSDIKNSERC